MSKHAMYAPRICAMIYLSYVISPTIADALTNATYLRALSFGNPRNKTRTTVIQGLKCPPDVPLQIPIASRMPNA